MTGVESVESQYSFITDEDSVNLARYEIDPDLLTVLRSMHTSTLESLKKIVNTGVINPTPSWLNWNGKPLIS